MQLQFPTVGRTVHYHSYGTPNGEYKPIPRAAIITEVDSTFDQDTHEFNGTYPAISLCVLNPTGMFFNQGVPFAKNPTPGCWNWPPR